MTKRITIKTQDDAVAYLLGTGFDVRYMKTDDEGNLFEEHRVTCKRCGGAGYYPTPRHGACYECNGNPPNYIARTGIVAIAKKARKAELAAAGRKRKADAKNAAFNARVTAAATDFDAAFPTMRADLADYLPLYCEEEGYNVAKKTHRILNDMASKLAKWGSLSEKQVAFAQKMLDDESAPKATIEEGRREVTGTVVSVKYHEGNWGSSYKMTVKLADGCMVWGTIPAALETVARDAWNAAYNPGDFEDVLKGATITYTVTVTRSEKSSDFGFGKRPTIADKDIALAWTAPAIEGIEPCVHCDSHRHESEDCPAEAAFCRMSDDR
jgi:hypothetical protein